MKKYYVYQIISSLTNEIIYIGKGSGNRMMKHSAIALGKSKARNRNPKLYNKIESILKNGGKIIPIKIYESESEEDVLNLEIKIISDIGLNNLCNLTLGGEGTRFPNGFSESHKQNISIAKRNKARYRKDGSKFYHTEETKEKLALIATGKPGYWKNKNLYPETKLKMRDSHKDKVFTQEHRNNLSKALMGKKNSKKRFTPTKEELKNAFEKFKTQKLLANHFKCSQRTIGRRLKESNII